ncbi:MAG TPA: T9SS type A sorting domain-containing protein [Bacteroidia bacterium]|jgi:hypothetical protein|nr:T9SS type A sorting domain-containing protein [Bacteroidia bacterium]
MKKITLATLALSAATLVSAQSNNPSSNYIPCSGFSISIPVRDMRDQTEAQREAAALHHDEIEANREAIKAAILSKRFSRFVKAKEETDPAVQATDGVKTLTAPIINVDGQTMSSGCPPDPDGAVGSTQYVQAINSSYQVFNKSGAALTGVKDLVTLFPGSSDDGDPIVLYDKFADRWFIAEFEISKSPVELLVAISKTNDATGAFYIYKFTNPGWSGSNFPDYPKYSIWSDGYYVTNQWPLTGSGAQIGVMDRARMLAGKSSAGIVYTTAPTPPDYFGGNNSLFCSAKTLDCDASAIPPYGTPTYMAFFENTNSGGYSDEIVLYKMVHDTGLKTLTITKSDSLAPLAFNAYFTGGTEQEITQPGLANSLDALDGTFNFRVPFMSFTGYNSIVLCNTVNTGGLVAGIRWYELRQSGAGAPWSIYQQGTYAPSDGSSRWNGSIGMDQDGDIGLQYSVSSGSVYPSIRYTGRMASDPLGTMTGTETTVVTGSTTAVNCGNRWGDYSETTLDPSDNVTFWNTNEYDRGGAEATRIFSFELTSPKGIQNLIDLSEFKVYQTGNDLNVIASKLPSDDQVQVDMFDIVGKQLSTQYVKPTAGNLQIQINVSSLPKAMYFVRVGNINYQRVFKVELN